MGESIGDEDENPNYSRASDGVVAGERPANDRAAMTGVHKIIALYQQRGAAPEFNLTLGYVERGERITFLIPDKDQSAQERASQFESMLAELKGKHDIAIRITKPQNGNIAIIITGGDSDYRTKSMNYIVYGIIS